MCYHSNPHSLRSPSPRICLSIHIWRRHCQDTTSELYRSQDVVTTYCPHYLSRGNGHERRVCHPSISSASLRTLTGAHTGTCRKSDVVQPDLSNECRVLCRL